MTDQADGDSGVHGDGDGGVTNDRLSPAPLKVWIDRRINGEITDEQLQKVLGIHSSQGGIFPMEVRRIPFKKPGDYFLDEAPTEPTDEEVEAGAKELYLFSQTGPTRPGHFERLDPFYRQHYFNMARRVLIAARQVAE